MRRDLPILRAVAGKPILLATLLGVVCLGTDAFGADAPENPSFVEIPGVTTATTNTTDVVTNVAAPQATSGTNAMDALDDKHRLAIGDRLSFRIVEDEEDPKPLFVTDSGDLELPYIGRYPAEGKTCLQLARELKKEFEKDYYHNATVIVAVDVMAKTRGRVYLVGPVRAGGPQEVPTDEVFTLSKAILRAGGFTDFADRKSVRVTRKGGAGGQDKVFTVDVAQILERGKSELDVVLEPGDFIYIPEKSIRF
jgi:protein involved in polysaccharide export with SLBB domain